MSSLFANPTSDPAIPPLGQVMVLSADQPMRLDSGATLGPFTLAYQTYGTLNEAKSNAILVCHALTGDQYAAGPHPMTGRPGWWSTLIGPGKPVDTERYFVICPNVIGGCMGSSGPREINPATGQVWGLNFPVITIADMVRSQALLLDALGIDRLFAVLGGSMGGMQALEWATAYPERVFAAIPIATAARHSSQNIAFHEVGRQAIMADPDWAAGAYHAAGRNPSRGLAVARMAAHVTYLSETALHRKFGRNLQDRIAVTYGFDADFQVESYLRHQGSTFVDRFDANSYLYITRAMDYFDLAVEYGGQLANAFASSPVRFLLVSFTSDWLFPTPESRAIVKALTTGSASVSFVEIETDKGHDAFLLDEPELFRIVQGFLDGCAEQYGLAQRSSAQHAESKGPKPRRGIRADLKLIADMIRPGSRALDVGSGDGELLEHLVHDKGVDGRGLELDPDGVHLSLAHGMAVIQGDANTDLQAYADGAFDYVILSKTLQAMHDPRAVLEHLCRIGHHAIVSFENYGHWRTRLSLMLRGRSPIDRDRPNHWWESSNIHPCTIADFLDLTEALDIEIEETVVLGPAGRVAKSTRPTTSANLFGEQAVFLLRRRR
ncbi:MAG: homoserine O-acetyltransferase [Rhodospirillales bacterium]|nr:homoserine O-acetyltransferase [Rhodospirillales bacterium]